MGRTTFDVTISGPAEDISRLREQVGRPITTLFGGRETTHSSPVFAMANIVPPNLGECPNYWGLNAHGDAGSAHLDWNDDNWGVLWDTALPDNRGRGKGIEVAQHIPDEITYSFQNGKAGIPREALNALADQYPTLRFAMDYDDWISGAGTVEWDLPRETGAGPTYDEPWDEED